MIFIQRRIKRDIAAAQIRLQTQRAALAERLMRQKKSIRSQTATPGKIAAAFAAGFLCERLRPIGWRVLSSATGMTLSLFEHRYLAGQLTRLFNAVHAPAIRNGANSPAQESMPPS